MDNEEIREQQDELNIGSQVHMPVGRFGNYSNKSDKEDLRNKIEASKTRNIDPSKNSSVTPSMHTGGGSSLGAKPSIDDDSIPKGGLFSSLRRRKKKRDVENSIAGARSDGGIMGGVRDFLSGGSEKTGGLLGLGSKAKGAATSGVAGKALVSGTAKAVITFFSTPVGLAALFVIGLFLVVLLFTIFFPMVISSLGMKFGLTGDQTHEVFRDEYDFNDEGVYEVLNEGYKEGLSREDVEALMDRYESDPDHEGFCEEGMLDKIKHFFDIWDLSDRCELMHYIKKMLKDKESHTKITTISPGYIVGSLYYSFDTQNRKEDGTLFIEPFEVPNKYKNNHNIPADFVFVDELDAISTMMGYDFYDKYALDVLLDNYIFHRYFTYWRWEWVYPEKDEDDEEEPEPYQTCVMYEVDDYDVSSDRFKLYLRYGENVSNAFEDQRNKQDAWLQTSAECQDHLDFESVSMANFFDTADPNSDADDNAKVTIAEDGVITYDEPRIRRIPVVDEFGEPVLDEEGKAKYVEESTLPEYKAGTYGYDSGFIFETYPRYMEEYNVNHLFTYDYMVDKDIELIVQYIESRQDYINYMLGYPNEIPLFYDSSSNVSIGGGAVCTFNIDGENYTDIKVRLLHAPNNAAIPGVDSYQPIEGQELVNFDKYILGVTYAENGGAPKEAMKAQAIATASYILSHANKGNNIRLVKENGQNILEVSNSTFNQTYCDPDKGCYICVSPANPTIQTVLTTGTVPEGSACKPWKGPLSESSDIRTAVGEVSGKILVNSAGKIASGNYTSDTQKAWNSAAENGADYVEILKATYGDAFSIMSSDCSFTATGNWASWRQFNNPWGSKLIANKTMKQVGCLITANAMMLANSGKKLVISDFNPGTYLDLLKRSSGTLSGNALYNDRAIEVALGNHDFSYTSEPLYGSYENKVKKIADKLREGYHVIISVKNNGHWVYVTGVSGNLIYMSDPASSKVIVTDRYSKEGIATIKYVKFY